MQILYIEDDLVDQLVFKRLVKSCPTVSYQIADSLEMALAMTRETDFDVLLTDYYLPCNTAEDVMNKIRNVPIFVITGLEDEERIREIKGFDIKGCIQKPLLKEHLAVILKNEDWAINEKGESKIEKEERERVLDFSYFKNMTRVSERLKNEMVAIFIDVASEEYENIIIKTQNKNWDDLAFSFHKLKSNLRIVGLKWLLRKANEYEQKCIAKENMEGIEKGIEVFLYELKNGIILAKDTLKERETV